MEPDIDAIYEKHYETYLNQCDQDALLEGMVYEMFSDIDDAFDILYGWDAEYLTSDPFGCICAWNEEQLRKKNVC